ncbi:hypothetical protein F383_38476 [Gossypium arboreum]|uniref:Uncharacterized protein n=1 Tax=Gossypium arboreum TaxID=29729 RepID=A0A0B0MFD0_GOSAR|nr:hypothetical protein F383_38476 [Gossypium arboreum]
MLDFSQSSVSSQNSRGTKRNGFQKKILRWLLV